MTLATLLSRHFMSSVIFLFLVPLTKCSIISFCRALIEEWIVGKYLREEFSAEAQQVFMSGYLEEFFMKRGKEDPKYYPRRFVLDQNQGTIRYYVREVKVT